MGHRGAGAGLIIIGEYGFVWYLMDCFCIYAHYTLGAPEENHHLSLESSTMSTSALLVFTTSPLLLAVLPLWIFCGHFPLYQHCLQFVTGF